MAPVLALGTRSHIRNRFADPQLVTDFDGGIRLAYLLRAVTWPWSRSPLSGFPDGESLVRVQAVSQGIQLVAIHLLTRVFQPVLSMNLIVLVGWITTGVAVYGLARRLDLDRWWAVGAGVLTQMLPAMPTMAANFTSYVYIGVPIYVISRSLDMVSAPSRRNLVAMCTVLGATLFFDPYWFFFSLAACVVTLLVNVRTVLTWVRSEPQWMQLLALTLCLVPVLTVTAMLSIGGSQSPGGTSRPVSVETARFIDAGLRAPVDWFRSRTEGLGVVLASVGVASVAVVARRRRDPKVTGAVAVVVTMVALSTRTRIELPWFTIGSAAEYARFVMPGVRFFQRAALIAEAMLCVFAVAGVRWVVQRRTHVAAADPVAHVDPAARVDPVDRRSRRSRRGVAMLSGLSILTVASVVELEPYARAYTHRWDDFAAIRESLAAVDEPVLLALPFGRHGRGWLEFSMLEDVPVVNAMYTSRREELTAVAASRGVDGFAAYLRSLGVTHLLAMTGEAAYPVSFEFAEPYFELRTTLMLDGYGEPDEEVALYELSADAVDGAAGAQDGGVFDDGLADGSCTPDCLVGDTFDFITATVALDDPGDADDVLERSRGYWAAGAEMRIQILLETLLTVSYRAVGAVTVTNPCTADRSVELTIGTDRYETVVEGGASTQIAFPLSSVDNSPIVSIVNDGPACSISGTVRPVTLQVSEPELAPVDQPLGVRPVP